MVEERIERSGKMMMWDIARLSALDSGWGGGNYLRSSNCNETKTMGLSIKQ